MTDSGEWTADRVKDLLDREMERLAELRTADKDAVAVALQVVKDQRTEDRRSDENWRASANEYRGQLKDQAATFLTRAEFEQFQRTQAGDRAASGTSLRGMIAIGLTALGLVISLVVIAANAFIGK